MEHQYSQSVHQILFHCSWLSAANRTATAQSSTWSGFWSKNLLIRRRGWTVLKADEKSMNITRTYDPENQICIYNTSSGLVHALRSATETTTWLHGILSILFARTDVKAIGLKSFICFTLGFFGTAVMIQLFHARGTDILSRNNWNRRANTGPNCGAHTLSTLPVRPSRPGA